MSIQELECLSQMTKDILCYSTATDDIYMIRSMVRAAIELSDAVAHDLALAKKQGANNENN